MLEGSDYFADDEDDDEEEEEEEEDDEAAAFWSPSIASFTKKS